MKHLADLVDKHVSLVVGRLDKGGRLREITERINGHIRKVENPQGRDGAYFPDDNHCYVFQSDSGDMVRITKRGKHNKVRYTYKGELYINELEIGNLNVKRVLPTKVERANYRGYRNSHSRPS